MKNIRYATTDNPRFNPPITTAGEAEPSHSRYRSQFELEPWLEEIKQSKKWIGAVAFATLFFLGMRGGQAQGIHTTSDHFAVRARLQPLAAEALPLGSIKPAGWLRRQLEIQAAGLSGHLDEFWPDVADSAWIGGKGDAWENGPYWLDGFIPLAIELDDPVLKARAQKWVDYILNHQQEDGWLGPMPDNPDPALRLNHYDVWPRFVMLKALTQWQEATGDKRIIPAMTRFLHCLDKTLDQKPLDEWARARWADLSLSIYWLHHRTGESWLLDLAAKTHAQGLDWAKLARDFPYREKITQRTLDQFKEAAGGKWVNDQYSATHGVNIGMGIKAPGVWFRQSGEVANKQATQTFLNTLDQYHGQATGIFSCDEHIAGRNPSQGTELCTVVETMFSLETLLEIMPDVSLADRLESIAYNALPAPFRDDMWAHQYDQQANQVVCQISADPVYSNNGPDANLFGLEPHFSCCLANFSQGWPKLTSHLWMNSSAGGLMAMAYAPCDLKTRIGTNAVQVSVRTDYPFDGVIDITLTSARAEKFPMDLRIPAWADGATVSLNDGKLKHASAGTFYRIQRKWSGTTKIRLVLPLQLRAERWFNDSVTIYRGPLVFSLEVGEDWHKLRDRKPTADWEVLPTTPWNYALLLDTNSLEKGFQVKTGAVAESPFSPDFPAIRLLGQARRIPDWKLQKNAAAAPPKSPVVSVEPKEDVELVPYGCAKLRVTEIPVLR